MCWEGTPSRLYLTDGGRVDFLRRPSIGNRGGRGLADCRLLCKHRRAGLGRCHQRGHLSKTSRDDRGDGQRALQRLDRF